MKNRKKICFYSPYIPDHFGGGEKYIFDAVTILAKKHDVSIAITSNSHSFSDNKIRAIRKSYEEFLDYSLKKINFIPTPIRTSSFILNKISWTKQFDVIYYATDGSLFFSKAKRNILHIQIPFTNKKSSILDRIKLLNWKIKNTNSAFTKTIIEKYWKTKINYIHYPMVELEDNNNPSITTLKRKKRIILHVGRFFRQLHSKKQEVLVSIFKEMLEKNPKETKGWQLIFVGNIEDKSYFNQIKKEAKGLPIKFFQKIKREKLIQLYKDASIYWHATGFGINQNKYPEKMEHFGISTVEAMSLGCAPVVIGKGGQPEVLGDGLKNYLWETKKECLDITLSLINNKQTKFEVQQKAIKQSKEFSKNKFKNILLQMVEG